MEQNSKMKQEMDGLNMQLDEANSEIGLVKDQIYSKIERIVKVEKERDEARI